MIHPYSYSPGRSAQWWPDKIALIEGEKKSPMPSLINVSVN
jgi:hypothetical protein